jgi:hypothetical protein
MVSRLRKALQALVVAMALLSVPLLLFVPHAEAAFATPLAVVVHPAVPVSNVSLAELRDLVLGNQRFWKTGLRVELVVRAVPSPEREGFVVRLSGMSEIQFQQYWIGQVFRGRATSAPRAVPDPATAVALVAALPGALSLVETTGVGSSVRVLTVDGRRPDDPAYALR